MIPLEDLYDNDTLAAFDRPPVSRRRGTANGPAIAALVTAVGLGLAEVFDPAEPEPQVRIEHADPQDGLRVRIFGVGRGLDPRAAVALVTP